MCVGISQVQWLRWAEMIWWETILVIEQRRGMTVEYAHMGWIAEKICWVEGTGRDCSLLWRDSVQVGQAGVTGRWKEARWSWSWSSGTRRGTRKRPCAEGCAVVIGSKLWCRGPNLPRGAGLQTDVSTQEVTVGARRLRRQWRQRGVDD